MIIAQLERVFRALNQSDTRYVLVGGLAVIAHGYMRTTSDIDLVLALAPDNLERGLAALERLGYAPRQPVPIRDFIDATKREAWIREKHMLVFQLCTGRPGDLSIDVFMREPFDFAKEYAAAQRVELAPDIRVPVATLQTLITLKRAAGRPNDLDDLRRLKLLFPHEFEPNT